MFSVISDNADIRKCNVKPNETGNPPSLNLIKILGISHLRDGVDLQSKHSYLDHCLMPGLDEGGKEWWTIAYHYYTQLGNVLHQYGESFYLQEMHKKDSTRYQENSCKNSSTQKKSRDAKLSPEYLPGLWSLKHWNLAFKPMFFLHVTTHIKPASIPLWKLHGLFVVKINFTSWKMTTKLYQLIYVVFIRDYTMKINKNLSTSTKVLCRYLKSECKFYPIVIYPGK